MAGRANAYGVQGESPHSQLSQVSSSKRTEGPLGRTPMAAPASVLLSCWAGLVDTTWTFLWGYFPPGWLWPNPPWVWPLKPVPEQVPTKSLPTPW